MRIDINACFGHWPYWDLPHKTPAELVGLMDRAGIDRAAVMSLRAMLVDWRAGNEETLAAAKAHPGRFIPAATLSPFLGGGGDEVRRLAGGGFRLLRLYPQFQSFSLESDFADEVAAAAGESGLPVMIPTRPMMNWRFKTLAIETVGALAVRHPKTTFVLSGPNYLAEFQAVVRLMRKAPNVWCETTCFQGFGALRRLVEDVGADRILFGTGAVLHYPACNAAKLDRADLTEPQRTAIASANAGRLMRLEG
ncbi:MAG: amidohydrolase [Phycisphaerae bacterium]|jgi:hypothetical protein